MSVKRVTATFFRTFAFRVAAGREFTLDDQDEGRPRVAIVSEAFLRRFPAHGVGKPLRLGGKDFTVVGVLPDRHWFPSAGGTDVWLPLPVARDGTPLVEPVVVTARLRGGADLAQARAQLAVVTARLTQGERAARPRKLALITLEQDKDKRTGFGLVGLLGPSIVVLLIACGNVANLLLARAARREREMAVRAALGAGRSRLLRERLAESAWPALAGGALGVALAFLCVALLRAWIGSVPASHAAAQAIRIDGRALLFAFAVTAVIPFVFGLVPAFVASRPNLQAALHQSPGRRKPRRGPYGGRDLLVVVEIGLAVVLVVCAGMFARFFTELGRLEWGFDATRVLAVELTVKRDPARPGSGAALVEDALKAVREVPGVQSAANGGVGGLEPSWRSDPIEFEGCLVAPRAAAAVASSVDDAYFATLRLPIRRGRAITGQDKAGAPRVGVISILHAERCWPGQDPIGRRFRIGRHPDAAWATVVGVAANALTTRALDTAQPVYVPIAQGNERPGTILVRAAGDPAGLVALLRAAIRRADPAQPGDNVERVGESLRAQLNGSPVLVGIVGGFGTFALALGALGVFSVTSYMVAERTREFGIRAALGASPWDVHRLVVRQALVIVAIGSAISAAGTIAVTRFTFPELAALALGDPSLWLAVSGLLALVALGASVVPARRAMRVQPVVALRAE